MSYKPDSPEILVFISGLFLVLFCLSIFIVALSVIYHRRFRLQQISRYNELMQAEEKVFSRLAARLHDEWAPSLSYVRMSLDRWRIHEKDLQVKETNEEMQAVLEGCFDGFRSLSHELLPPLLEFGIDEALNEYANRVEYAHNFKIYSDIADVRQITDMQKLACYRIVIELVENARKYSGVDEAHIRISSIAGLLIVKVSDAGSGFSEQQLKSKGIGLKNIQNRLSLLGGKFHLDTKPGKGTIVTIMLPDVRTD